MAALLLVASGMASCGSSDSKGDGRDSVAEELPTVQVSTVHEQEVAQTGEYTATVEAFKTNNISSSSPNRIKSIAVEVGAHVRAGQRVATLDDVNIAQLKVRLDNTEREYQRAVKLLEIGAGTQQSVDQLKTELDATRRQYSNLVENTVLVSPISGVVTARNYDPGDMTGAQPILTIEQIHPVKVLVNISESEFAKVKKGMKAEITFDSYPGEQFTGEVYLVHPEIDPATRTFTAEITIANSGDKVVPGMFARVRMGFGSASRVVVPDRAIVKQPGSGNKYIYVYDPKTQTVAYRQVELGQRMDDAYELLSGVENGAQVVVSGQSRLADGVKVKVIK